MTKRRRKRGPDAEKIEDARKTMEQPTYPGRYMSDAEALEIYKIAMIEANDLHATDPAAAVLRATDAALELNHQIGIGQAQSPLLGLKGALEERRFGRFPEWLKVKESAGGNRLLAAERHRRALTVAILNRLLSGDMGLDEAADQVAAAISVKGDEITGNQVKKWRERVQDYCPAENPDFFDTLFVKAHAFSTDEVLDLLQRMYRRNR